MIGKKKKKEKKSKTFVYFNTSVSFMACYKGKIIADFLNR